MNPMSLPVLQDPDLPEQLPALQDPEDNRVQPNFLQKVGLIADGTHRGVTQFTSALLSKLPFGETFQKGVQANYDKVEKDYQDATKTFKGYYPQAGSLLGETLITMPAGAALGGVVKGASALGKLAPTGLKTVAKYGTAAAGGAGVLAGMESQRYDPENPEQLINKEAAMNVLESPYSLIPGAAVAKLSTWGEASRKLGRLKEAVPHATASTLKEGITKTISDEAFGAITSSSKQLQKTKGIGDDLYRFVSQTAGDKNLKHSIDLTEYAGKKVQSALKNLAKAEDDVWNKGFKVKPIAVPQDVKNEVISALDLIEGTGISSEALTKKTLIQSLRNGNMKVEDAKKIMSTISNAAINAKNAPSGTGLELYKSLRGVKDNIMGHIKNSIDPEDLADLTTASEFSARKFQTFAQAPRLEKAIRSEANAQLLVKNMISESGVMPPKRVAKGILDYEGSHAIDAAKISKAIEQADNGTGHIDVDKFLRYTAEFTQTPKILNTDTYKALEGMKKYLGAMSDTAKAGGTGKTAVAGTLGALGAAGGVTAGTLGGAAAAAIPLASLAAMKFVSNHSPLKRIFHAMTKNLPESTYNLLVDSVGKQLSRAGFLYSQDGVLKHKDDTDLPPLEDDDE